MSTLMRLIFYLIAGATILSSCTKVIDVNLNDKDPQFVIEAYITLGESTHRVSITKTQNFDASSTAPNVEDAIVILRDDLGAMMVLSYVGSGIYEATNFPALEGRTYTLEVSINTEKFIATEKMPQNVPLDSIATFPFSFGPQSVNAIIPIRMDPAGEENYYQFIVHSNGKRIPGSFIQTDQYNDGNKMMEPIFSDGTDSGDTVLVEMHSISKAIYKYFFQLQANQQGATPANPTSNFSGGCLGFLSVRTKDTLSIIIP